VDIYDESIYTPDEGAVVSTVGGAVATIVLGYSVDPDTLEVGSITEISKKNKKNVVRYMIYRQQPLKLTKQLKARLHYAQFLVQYHFFGSWYGTNFFGSWYGTWYGTKWYGYQFYPCRTKN
jgi:hypothetical protein